MAINRYMSADDRFWCRVKKTDRCWLWTGKPDRDGYGRIRVNNKQIRAHRYSYMIHYGDLPDEYLVLHECDNPACVNPNHLTLGTIQDNNEDRRQKGRSASGTQNASVKYPGIRKLGSKHHWAKGKPYHHQGEKNGRAKLNEDDVRKIRAMWIDGQHTKKSLGQAFNVTDVVIGNIVRGKSWTHIK